MPRSGLRAWVLIQPHSERDRAAHEGAERRVFGLSALERIERSLRRTGVDDLRELSPDEQPPDPSGGDGHALVVRGDFFVDERLIAALAEGEERVLLSRDGDAVAARVDNARLADAVRGLRANDPGALAPTPTASPGELVPDYNKALRKLDPAFAIPAASAPVASIENQLFAGAYKGLTDVVTKWVWPLPARAATRWLSVRGVHPNTVTAVSYGLTILATLLFYMGWFGAGLVAAWLMTFLDTVDGKLARVTLTSSRLGGALDHGLDLVHPPIWWAAWAFGMAADPATRDFWLAIVVGGYVLGRLLEGVFMLAFDMEMFTWRRFDGLFRTVIARRNPNLLMLTAATALARPDLGFAAVGVLDGGVHRDPGRADRPGRRPAWPGRADPPLEREPDTGVSTCGGRLAGLALAAVICVTASAAAGEGAGVPIDPAAAPARRSRGRRALGSVGATRLGSLPLRAAPDHEHRARAAHGALDRTPGLARRRRARVSRRRTARETGPSHPTAASSAIDASHYTLRPPRYRLVAKERDVSVDLSFDPIPHRAGATPEGATPPGLGYEVVAFDGAASGTVWEPSLDEPMAVTGTREPDPLLVEGGRVGTRPCAASSSSRSAAERGCTWWRSPHPRACALSGSRSARARKSFSSTTDFDVDLRGETPLVWEARLLGARARASRRGSDFSGEIALRRRVLEHDPLGDIPQPLRFLVGLQMKPHRVWAEAAFQVTLPPRPGNGSPRTRTRGEG